MEIIKQLKYHSWAETEFYKSLENITDNQWTKIDPKMNKSLQGIYGHKVEVMWFWFQLIKQLKPKDSPNFENMTKEEIFSSMFQLFDEIKQFIQTKPDKELIIDLFWLDNKSYPITIYELLFNIFNHHTYHRGQIVILLKRLGITPPETDYNPFIYDQLNLF